MIAGVDRAVTRVPRWVPVAAYRLLLAAGSVLTVAALGVGLVAWTAALIPALAAALVATGEPWAWGILAAVPTGGLTAQGVLDYTFSLLSLVVAGRLVAGEKSWSTRLLVLAMVTSAGAFNLQAHATLTTVWAAVDVPFGSVIHVLHPAVAGAAFILALLVFPPERESRPGSTAGIVLAGAGTLLLAGFGTALVPYPASCVLFLGFLGPIVGVVLLPGQIRGAPTATARTQARLLFSVLAVVSAIATVLVAITAVMWASGWGSLLMLEGPTPVSGEPTALLFWFSRAASIAIAGAMFVATRRAGLWNAERLFSRGLAAGLTAALVGGGYVVVRSAVGWFIEDGVLPAAVLATAVGALALRPVYVGAERWADRLLFGSRPTPYSALAGVAALSRVTTTDAPDLTRVAEAVGRGLGATTCRLTVTRPGLRDRSYTWAEQTGSQPDRLVEVAVRHGSEEIGTLAVDYAAVAGLQQQRRHLLEDVADSLGAVLQASRYGIELERQLRAAIAHAGEIAASRRAVVAEMDGERRRIERDLHDGAQHHLVSLRLTLGLVEHQVSTAQFGKARDRLEQVAGQIDMAESILAETAMGVSSPLLAEAGLVRALEKELAGGQPPVAVDAVDVGKDGRFPPDVESAVYFCCLEAVNNARKHAHGAAIEVRLSTVDGRLRFTVRDDGPGWDQRRVTESPGRGLRNVATRITAVGGRIEVRSAPGKGTTVDGSVPLPGYVAPRTPLPERPARALPAPAQPLLDQVREAVREALAHYQDTAHVAVVRALAERLDAPLRIAVPGADDGLPALLPTLAALDPDGTPMLAGAALVDPAPSAGRPEPRADAFVVLLRRGADGQLQLPEPPDLPDGVTALARSPSNTAPRHRPAHAVGVLVVEGPIDASVRRAAADCAARPDVRRLCHVIVPLAPALARAGVRLSDEQHRALEARAGEVAEQPAPAMATAGTNGAQSLRAPARVPAQAGPLPFEPAVVQFAVAAIRSGRAPTREALAAALVQGSGLPQLRELVVERLTRRGDTLRSRSVLLALEDLVGAEPPPAGGRSLSYRLDRIRAQAHELVELDVVDALREGATDLPDDDRRAAERLLGAAGTDPRTRLGLAGSAGRPEVVAAATEQLARWQRRAASPLSGVDVRKAADVLVQACERLLVDTAERGT